MRAFLEAADGLRKKLGPVLLQFPYFNKKAFASADPFLERLAKFLKKLPRERRAVPAGLGPGKGGSTRHSRAGLRTGGDQLPLGNDNLAHVPGATEIPRAAESSGATQFRYALEVRNKAWVGKGLLEILRDHGVALAMIDHPWMMAKGQGSPTALWESVDAATADFAYVRLLGDRYGIEEQTKTWDKVIVDRRRSVTDWVKFCRKITRGGEEVYVYINNHYAGHAPATVRMFLEMWAAKAAAASR